MADNDTPASPHPEQTAPEPAPQAPGTDQPKGDMVPTKDLLAVKKSLEGKLETAQQEAQAKQAELQAQVDTLTNQLSQAQAKAQAAEESTQQGAAAEQAVAEAKQEPTRVCINRTTGHAPHRRREQPYSGTYSSAPMSTTPPETRGCPSMSQLCHIQPSSGVVPLSMQGESGWR